MKKVFLFVMLLYIVGTSTLFSEGIFGMDFSFRIKHGMQRIYFENTTTPYPPIQLSRNDFSINMKFSSYNYFLFDNTLGLYLGVGLMPIATLGGETVNAQKSPNFMTFNAAGSGVEFFAGPAFGINFGESNIRFQTGIAFHYMLMFTWAQAADDKGVKYPEMFSTYGIGFTPQLRFDTNEFISFVLGIDVSVDFILDTNRTAYPGFSEPLTISSFCRFAFDPHIACGLNF